MAAECDVQSEIEVLESIYLDELQVNGREDGSWEVSLVLYPSTGEDSVSQFVRLTLTLTLDQQELTVVCPVCREPLAYDVDQLLLSPAPQLPELDEAAIGSDFQQKWVELQKLLERQRSKGGIIDPEEESNRFLIHINEVSSASNVSPDDSSVRTDQFVPGVSHCRGGQGPRRQHQMRGPKRGGRSRPHHGRAAPVTEQLDKLSLSSDCTEGPVRAQGTLDPQMPVNAEKCEVKARRDVNAELAPETECQNDNGDSSGGRGHRGRRRGPHRPAPHSGGPGPSRYHWDGRPSRSRGGANSMYSRGGGPHRGHGRGYQQKVVERERGREEVL
ncbi:hypothetical protein INR49_017934 [Caranx melampygus]|nr:hypothetical protein INR49_017934 [Caranx melampygus]